jgi:hypothetical protein
MTKNRDEDQFSGFDGEGFAVIRSRAPNIVVRLKEINIVIRHVLPLFGQESSFRAHCRKKCGFSFFRCLRCHGFNPFVAISAVAQE